MFTQDMLPTVLRHEEIARYSDGSTKEVTDYDVIGGENLTQDITSVTIRYTENGIIKTTTQPITVNSNETEITLSEIYIEEEPTKTVYEEVMKK